MTHYTNTGNPIDFPKIDPNPKIRELIMSMGIIPESEHYEIAEAVVKKCIDIASKYDEPKMSGPGLVIGSMISEHFGGNDD